MTDLETRLTAALHADAPPARDAMFRVEALVRLERGDPDDVVPRREARLRQPRRPRLAESRPRRRDDDALDTIDRESAEWAREHAASMETIVAREGLTLEL